MYGVKAHGKHLKRNEEFLHILYLTFLACKKLKNSCEFSRSQVVSGQDSMSHASQGHSSAYAHPSCCPSGQILHRKNGQN